MYQVNVLEAKTNFSKLLYILETEQDQEIIIAKNRKPMAKLMLLPKEDMSKRIGAAKGKIQVPDDFDDFDSDIATLFYGKES